MYNCKKIFLTVLLLVVGCKFVLACGHPPPTPPPTQPQPPPPEVWMIDHGIDPISGKSNMWFGVEIDPVLFPITGPTVCTCAIGLGGAGLPFVPSLNVTTAMIAVTDMVTHTIEPLLEFDFTPDGAITTDASANAILPGQQWFGLSATVQPFTQPVYGPNEILKLWFNLEIDPVDIETLRQATASTLLGFSIGGSPQDQNHLPQQFIGHKVPEPMSTLLFMLGIGMLYLVQRRS